MCNLNFLPTLIVKKIIANLYIAPNFNEGDARKWIDKASKQERLFLIKKASYGFK